MIRSFTLPDLNFLLDIEQQSFPKSAYDSKTLMGLYAAYPETFGVYLDQALEPRGKKILGYIVFSKGGHILSIAVHPAYRRRGIGKALYEKAIGTLRGRKVWAEVRETNLGAQAFYFKLGFRVTGRVPRYYRDEDALIIQQFPGDPPIR